MQRNTLIQFLLACAALVVILAGVKAAAEIVVPFLLSLFIAIICSPLIKWMTNRKVPHWLAISILFLLILLVFFFLIGLISSSIREFTQSIPQYKVLLSQRLNDVFTLAKKWNIPLNLDKDVILDKLDPSVVMNFVSSLLMNFSNVISNTFVLILVVIFMLLEAPTAKYKLSLVLSHNKQERWQEEKHIARIVQGIISYLGVKSAVSLLTGILVWTLLAIMDVQYAVLWATLTFLFNYIPNVGSIIAAVPIILQAFLLNGFTSGFIVAAGVIGINMIVGNLLEPKMMGRKLGLSTLVVFLSLLFWGWLLGTVGMLLSVPLTIVFKIILESIPSTERYAVLLDDVQDKKS